MRRYFGREVAHLVATTRTPRRTGFEKKHSLLTIESLASELVVKTRPLLLRPRRAIVDDALVAPLSLLTLLVTRGLARDAVGLCLADEGEVRGEARGVVAHEWLRLRLARLQIVARLRGLKKGGGGG